MTDPSSILPLTATTASLKPFETQDTRASVETERRQRSLIRTSLRMVGSEMMGFSYILAFIDGMVGMMKNFYNGSGPAKSVVCPVVARFGATRDDRSDLSYCHSYTDPTSSSTNTNYVRLHQRNGRKTLTTVEGMPKEVDPKKVLKVFKKDFACNGSIVQNEDDGQDIIQLQGDHRQKIAQLLIDNAICKKEDIQIHGF